MIRFILVAITLGLYLILGIPVLMIEWVIGKFNKRAADISSLRLVQGAFRLMLFISGAKVDVIGSENVPKDQPVLYIANHRSYFDILLTYSRCPGLTGYVAKIEMLKAPLLNIWMKRLYCLFLDRNNIKEGLKTILQGVEHLKNGISVCIFPEGTRTSGDEMLPFKEGSMKMAEKSGCPIIPIAISNSEALFEDQLPAIKPAHVIIEYGEPIYPSELSKEEKKFLGAYTQKKIAAMIEKNSKLLKK